MCFLDMDTNESHSRPFKPVVGLESSDKHLLIVTEADLSGQYVMMLCDTIGTSLDTRPIPFLPQHIAMTGTHAVASSGSNVYVWSYCNEKVPFNLHLLYSSTLCPSVSCVPPITRKTSSVCREASM